MKNDNHTSLRYGMFVPLALLIASIVTSCLSYTNVKHDIITDLNDAMITLANENSELWTRQDTIAALRQMHETTHKPLIYQATDVNFRHEALKEEAYFTLTLVDKKNATPKISGEKIASDSILLVPQLNVDGIAIQVQGFVDCSMASLFAASDQTLPGILLTLSVLSMASMFAWCRKVVENPLTEIESDTTPLNPLDNISLTPMQRRLAQMLLDSPNMRVDKTTLCSTLWGNKINAEESLYTLIRRTKKALSTANIDIICHRGDSYEIRINN